MAPIVASPAQGGTRRKSLAGMVAACPNGSYTAVQTYRFYRGGAGRTSTVYAVAQLAVFVITPAQSGARSRQHAGVVTTGRDMGHATYPAPPRLLT